MAQPDESRLETKIDDLRTEVQAVRLLVASMMPRAEVEAADSRRVAVELYTSDQREVSARLTRLEASPTRMLAYASGGVGCLGVLVSVASVAVFILEFVLTHYKP